MEWVYGAIIVSVIAAFLLKNVIKPPKLKYKTDAAGYYLRDFTFFHLLFEFASTTVLSMFAIAGAMYFTFVQRSIVFTPFFILFCLLLLPYFKTLYEEFQARKKR